MKHILLKTAFAATAIVIGLGSLAAQSRSIPSSKFEQGFLSSVPQHHQAAVDMAQLCLQKAVHPELKNLCQSIVTSQTEQEQQMKGWLQTWYGGKSAAPADMMAKMQAMQQEMMSKLTAATGNNFDHTFLMEMGQHHAEGVPEFKECVVKAKHPELKVLCGKMEATQKEQITQMNAWASAWK